MTGRASAAGGRGLPAETADVIVVGAGPAGSSVALRLARAGLDVLGWRRPGSRAGRCAATG